jgi:hypothetical protein
LNARYRNKLNLDALLPEEALPLRNRRQYRAEANSFEAKQIDLTLLNFVR